MVDQILLNDTLQKINDSLNKRFEKDAELYVSKQDEYEIKKNLCNGAYGGVVDMAKAKGISHDIILKVLFRNAGVLNVNNIKDFKKGLKPIFEDADYRALSYMMEDVLSSNVYMQKKVRHILFKYYVNGIPATFRVIYWKSKSFNFDVEERVDLFEAILTKVNHKDPAKTLEYRLEFVRDAFMNHPEIMKDKKIYCKLKDSLDDTDKEEFFKYLCKEMERPFIDNEIYNFILVDAYASYGEKSFNDAINQIKQSSPNNYKQYIKVIGKLFWKIKDKEVLVRMFDTIVRVFESPYIKRHVQREINSKIWKITKDNELIYNERKAMIDKLMADVTEVKKDKYKSFADVALDIQNGINPKSVAFFWVNIPSPIFEQSIMDSFTGIGTGYLLSLQETYSWLFDHSKGKGGMEELQNVCNKIAFALNKFSLEGKDSQFFNKLDKMWLDNVVENKLQGSNIEHYMFDAHFDKVKEWK